MPRALPVLAFDLGATNLRCGLVDADGTLGRRESRPTPPGPDLANMIADLGARVADSGRPAHAVVGVRGRVDYASGRLEWGRNQPREWDALLEESALSTLLGLPVSLANDADLATVGEARFGAAMGYRSMTYVTISSGVGAGAVLDGRLVHGRAKLCEIGLTILGLPARPGEAPVLLEDLASGSGLRTAATRQGIDAGAESIVAAIRAGDHSFGHLWERYSMAVAATAVNIAHLLLPEIIVIGGGVSSAGDLLLTPVREWLARYGPQDLPRPIDVAVAALADDAGLVGAAAWTDAFGPHAEARASDSAG